MTLEAKEYAIDCMEEFRSELVGAILETPLPSGGIDKLPSYLKEPIDRYVTEINNCHQYSLRESVQILEDYSEFEREVETHLWKGLRPKDAIASMAHYMMQKAIFHFVNEIIEALSGIEPDNELEMYLDGDTSDDEEADKAIAVDEAFDALLSKWR